MPPKRRNSRAKARNPRGLSHFDHQAPEPKALLNSMRAYRATPLDEDNNAVHPDSGRGRPQAHEGDLDDHTLWTEMYARHWVESRSPLADGVDVRLALAGAALHDIGKGGDCVETCMQEGCFFDMYGDAKYGGKGDRAHAGRGADVMLGREPYFTQCRRGADNVLAGHAPLDVPALLAAFGIRSATDRQQLAVIADIHWEFGVINIPDKKRNVEQRLRDYLDKFEAACARLHVRPTETLLRTCILVSCADIAGASPQNLPQGMRTFLDTPSPKPKYDGTLPWTQYRMDIRAKPYLNALVQMMRTDHALAAVDAAIALEPAVRGT